VGFVVDKVALGQVFSEFFGFPCQFSFHQLLHNHRSSWAGTILPLDKLDGDITSTVEVSSLNNLRINNRDFFILSGYTKKNGQFRAQER
jgi:hypothetical protein